jgi:ferredoxin-like protein FixX
VDRLLLNPWISRAGNAAFLISVVLFVVRVLSGWNPLTLMIAVLLAIGVLLMAAPYFGRWRQRYMTGAIGRASEAALTRERQRSTDEIEHRPNCPRNAARVETYTETRRDGIEVNVTRCQDCGAARYVHADAPPSEWSSSAASATLGVATSDPAGRARGQLGEIRVRDEFGYGGDTLLRDGHGRSRADLIAATRRIETELMTIRRAVRDAIAEEIPPRSLPATEWDRHSDIFSDPGYTRVGDHGLRACRRAYVEADRLNHRTEGWRAPRSEGQLDELRELDSTVTGALRTLNTIIRTWP